MTTATTESGHDTALALLGRVFHDAKTIPVDVDGTYLYSVTYTPSGRGRRGARGAGCGCKYQQFQADCIDGRCRNITFCRLCGWALSRPGFPECPHRLEFSFCQECGYQLNACQCPGDPIPPTFTTVIRGQVPVSPGESREPPGPTGTYLG
jgi:hypothetical protein